QGGGNREEELTPDEPWKLYEFFSLSRWRHGVVMKVCAGSLLWLDPKARSSPNHIPTTAFLPPAIPIPPYRWRKRRRPEGPPRHQPIGPPGPIRWAVLSRSLASHRRARSDPCPDCASKQLDELFA
ncbi:unnamed protein product, partial [Darwinula stevensoni]